MQAVLVEIIECTVFTEIVDVCLQERKLINCHQL